MYSIWFLVSKSFFIRSLNDRNSSLFIAFDRDSIGIRCLSVLNPSKGFAPTLWVGELMSIKFGYSDSSVSNSLKSLSHSVSDTIGLSRT